MYCTFQCSVYQGKDAKTQPAQLSCLGGSVGRASAWHAVCQFVSHSEHVCHTATESEVISLLLIGAIVEHQETPEEAFFSALFTVPRKGGGTWPITNPRDPNRFPTSTSEWMLASNLGWFHDHKKSQGMVPIAPPIPCMQHTKLIGHCHSDLN